MNTKQQPTDPKSISLRVLDGQTELAEEDLERVIDFFNRWGRELFIGALIVIGAVYGYNVYESTRVNALKAGADRLHNVRMAYEETQSAASKIVVTEGADKENAQKDLERAKGKFKETLRALGDAKSPYKDFVSLYALLGAKVEGDLDLAKSRYEEVSKSVDTILSSPEGTKNLDQELVLLAIANSLLDNDAMKEKGFSLLRTLAEKGSVSSVSAYKTLAVLEEELPKETQDALPAIREGIISRHPELSDLLDK